MPLFIEAESPPEVLVYEILSEIQSWDYLAKPPLESLLKLQDWKNRLQALKISAPKPSFSTNELP
jgi:hypothetical protein